MVNSFKTYIFAALKVKETEGTESPLFLYLKMFEEKVSQLLEEFLVTRGDLFLISLDVSDNNSIKVIIDGDKGVSVQDCVAASRAIEHNLDRDEIDFSLEVTSAGATAPLLIPRQYKKNLSRKLVVKEITGDSWEGELVKADEEKITLKWKAREHKPVGKGKVTVTKEQNISINNIQEAKVKLQF